MNSKFNSSLKLQNISYNQNKYERKRKLNNYLTNSITSKSLKISQQKLSKKIINTNDSDVITIQDSPDLEDNNQEDQIRSRNNSVSGNTNQNNSLKTNIEPNKTSNTLNNEHYQKDINVSELLDNINWSNSSDEDSEIEILTTPPKFISASYLLNKIKKNSLPNNIKFNETILSLNTPNKYSSHSFSNEDNYFIDTQSSSQLNNKSTPKQSKYQSNNINQTTQIINQSSSSSESSSQIYYENTPKKSKCQSLNYIPLSPEIFETDEPSLLNLSNEENNEIEELKNININNVNEFDNINELNNVNDINKFDNLKKVSQKSDETIKYNELKENKFNINNLVKNEHFSTSEINNKNNNDNVEINSIVNQNQNVNPYVERTQNSVSIDISEKKLRGKKTQSSISNKIEKKSTEMIQETESTEMIQVEKITNIKIIQNSIQSEENNKGSESNYKIDKDLEIILNEMFDQSNKFFGDNQNEINLTEEEDTSEIEFELIKFYLKHKNLNKMYLWQEKCLQYIKNKNIIISLPTSAGKTLVAELLMLRQIIIHNKNVIFILPYISLVQEKFRSLSNIAIEMNFFLEEYAGIKGIYPPTQRRNNKKTIYICTIEKSSSLINSLIIENRINEIGLIVIDEFHILNEYVRGPILECLLSKILYINKSKELICKEKNDIQIFSMSATIGNINELANFIKGEVFEDEFRPTVLREYIKYERNLFNINYNKTDEEFISEYKNLGVKNNSDPDDIMLLLENGLPALIFCANKISCNNLANRLKLNEMLKENIKEKESLLDALAIETNGHLCNVLKNAIPFGIAYHHSGLSSGERKLIEEAYLDGIIKIICCTSTLAAGVNLPAKRVIIREPYVGRDFISYNMYKQMIGRAGRKGLQSEGESIIICKNIIDLKRLENLLKGNYEKVLSKLNKTESYDLIISIIETQICSNIEEVKRLFQYTLMYQQLSEEDKIKFMNENLQNVIDELVKNETIKIISNVETEKNIFKLTNVAKAAVQAGLSLTDSKVIYKDLHDSKKQLCILNSIHLLTLVIPFKYRIPHNGFGINFKYLMKRYLKFNKTEITSAEIIGVTEHLIAIHTNNNKDNEISIFLYQFLHAVVLYDVLNHEDIYSVCKFYSIPLGELSNFISETVYFISKIYKFCEYLNEFWVYKQLLINLPQKLSCCKTPEILSLMELPGVKMGRAKQLYSAGFINLEKIASSNIFDLVKNVQHISHSVARNIIASAKILIQKEIDDNQIEIERMINENKRKQGINQGTSWNKKSK